MNNNIENTNENKIEEKIKKTITYSNLFKKNEEQNLQLEIQNTENTEIKQIIKPKIRGSKNNLKNNNYYQKKNNFKKLTTEEYLNKLKNCQIVFINELNKYLREIIERTEKIKKEGDKKEFKKNKITNLERIQNGVSSVNIIRVISNRIEPSKLEFLNNLIKNKQIGFINLLTEYMNKYNVNLTYKSPNVILLHSPYIIV